MGRINFDRLILGGIVAGIVGDILGYLVDGVMLAPQWAAGMRALGRAEFSVSQNVAFNIIGLVYGILIVWLYAEIRPRYGAGPKTAVCAGLAVWGLGYLLASVTPIALHLFPRRLMAIGLAVGIVEVLAGTLAGAWLYREETA